VRQKPYGEILDLRLFFVQGKRQKEDHGEPGKLGRLKTHRSESEPAGRSARGITESFKMDGSQKAQGEQQDRIGQHVKIAVRKVCECHQRDDSSQCKDALFFEKVEIRAVFFQGQGRTCAVDHDDADAHEKQYREQEFYIIYRHLGCGLLVFHLSLTSAVSLLF